MPAYDFSESSPHGQSIRIETDHRAWWELMRRLNHMFDLGLSLSDLRNRSDTLTTSVQEKIDEQVNSTPRRFSSAAVASRSSTSRPMWSVP